MIVDTHCHIYPSEIKNAEEIIKKSRELDIQLILNGTDAKSNLEVLELSNNYDNVHGALGYFYTMADEITDSDIELLDNQLSDNSTVAVGEIGLDYYAGKENKQNQKELFEKMLVLAQKHNMPVIVHSRNAMQDTFDILKKYDVKGCLHSYQGSAEMARQFIKLGFYIGVGGTVTYKNSKKIKNTVKEVGINNIVLETDSPYLSPELKRGEKNTPLNLKYIIRSLSEKLGIGEDEVIRATFLNAKELFGI